MNTEVCVRPNPKAERCASAVAGGPVVNPRAVFKEYPSLQILSAFPNYLMLRF